MFVNPFDVMEVDGAEPPSYPEAKKASKKALLKFKLSDSESIEVGDARIERADFIKAVDALSEEENLDYYFALHREHEDLNRFLTSGDTKFFLSNHQASLFGHEGFQRFVSSSFAKQFSPLLARAVDEQNPKAAKALLSRTDLLLPEHEEQAYKPASRKITIAEDKIRAIADKEKEEFERQIRGWRKHNDTHCHEKHFDSGVLNVLPPYFESDRTRVAKATRQLGVRVFNELDDVDAAIEIIDSAASINTTAIAQRAIAKSRRKLAEIQEERAFAEKHKDKLQRWGEVISNLSSLAEGVQSDDFSPRRQVTATVRDIVGVKALNALPQGFNDLREHVAFALRNLSVAVWNHQEDIESAVSIIKTAKKINVSPETRRRLDEDFQQLKEVRKDMRREEREQLQAITNAYRQTKETVEKAHDTNVRIRWNLLEERIDHILSDEIMLFIANASHQSARNKAFQEANALLMTMANEIPPNAKNEAERLSKALSGKSVPIDFQGIIDQAERSQKQAQGCLIFGVIAVVIVLFFMFAS